MTSQAHIGGTIAVGGLALRRMRADDLDAVFAIEQRSYTEPWPLAFFRSQLERPTALCIVAEQSGVPVGYVIAERLIDVWHIMNLCVDAPMRRRHIATQLLEAYFTVAEKESHYGHSLEVRVSNDIARTLYRSVGFVAVGIRPHYYGGDKEDAVCMWRDCRGAPR